jgi:aldose 1-epimerase
VEITSGDQRVVVVTAGGGLRAYSIGGRELLDGFAAGERSTSGRGQVLIPWPNRLEDGEYEFDGRRHRLPITEPEHRNAIHGLVRDQAGATRVQHRIVTVEHELRPQPGYPFALALRLEYDLSASGLRVCTTATNVGTEACPYGAGAHPYLTVGTATVDSNILRAPGRTVLRTDERGLPVSAISVEARTTTSDNRGGSARPGSITRSPTSSEARTASRVSSSPRPAPAGGSRSGSMRRTPTSRSSRAIRCRTWPAAAWPSSR